ncbi:MAG: NADP-dependent oxidoreductase [Anaerolineae bacterium]|nr:NADP-dependent oxidoreductase [Anaerolineae bacterium]
MNAVRIHQFGGPEVLVYERAPMPEIAAGEVLVRVRAVGVNPVDWKTRSGSGRAAVGKSLPIILGWDVSGMVEAVAPDVTAFKPGDEVFGMVRFPELGSAYAEYVAAPATDLTPKPRSLTHVEAAAVPLVALTAWQALFDTLDLQPGQRILVHAAAGGVGHVGVQLARWRGADVIGTASAANEAFVRGLGASQVIDYTTTHFEEVVHDLDCVLDCVGTQTQTRSLAVIRPGGKLVGITGQVEPALAAARNIDVQRILVHTSGEQQAQIAELIDSGELKVEVGEVFPLREARQAHELSETRHARGKIVLEV